MVALLFGRRLKSFMTTKSSRVDFVKPSTTPDDREKSLQSLHSLWHQEQSSVTFCGASKAFGISDIPVSLAWFLS
jgi:hypothetical protein